MHTACTQSSLSWYLFFAPTPVEDMTPTPARISDDANSESTFTNAKCSILYSLLLYCFGVHWKEKLKHLKLVFSSYTFYFLNIFESEVTLDEEVERDLKY